MINPQSVALSPQITEATGWIVNERGNIELVNANQRVNTIALNTNC